MERWLPSWALMQARSSLGHKKVWGIQKASSRIQGRGCLVGSLSGRRWGEQLRGGAGVTLESNARGSWKGGGQIMVGCKVRERAFLWKQRTLKKKTNVRGHLLCARPCVNFFMYLSSQLILIKILPSVLIIFEVIEVLL